HEHAHLDDDSRTAAIHQPTDQRAEDRRDEKAERERARGHAALPPELVEDRREEERERGTGVDADRHGDEAGGHDDPAVEDGRAQSGVACQVSEYGSAAALLARFAGCSRRSAWLWPPACPRSSRTRAGSSARWRARGRAASRERLARRSWDIDTRRRGPPPRGAVPAAPDRGRHRRGSRRAPR